MTRASRSLTSLVLISGTVAVLVAQKSPLNLKAGLWEMTIQVNMPGGIPPGVDTSKMTPEQKTRMETMMKGRLGGTPTVTQSCVTQEDLDKNQVQKDPPGSECKTVVTKATATLVEYTQTCTGTMAGVREARLEAPTPTTMTMVAKSSSGTGAGMTVNMTGKWLAASCGTVK